MTNQLSKHCRRAFYSLLIYLFAAPAFAGTAPAEPPNFYDCRGRDIQVTYSSGNLDRIPHSLSLKLGANTYQYKGDQITTTETVLGTLITVYLKIEPDHQIETFSFVLPSINLTSEVRTINFNTVLAKTISRTTFHGPGWIKGIVNPSQYRIANCTAMKTE
jgi:hypothetical protein